MEYPFESVVKQVFSLTKGKGVIAGGFARDWWHNQEPKDVDVIMPWPEEVPRKCNKGATTEEMARLAEWVPIEITPWMLCSKICPNYNNSGVESGAFDDRIAAVFKYQMLVGDRHVDVDIIIPRHTGPIGYIREFDYNLNQFAVIAANTRPIYMGEGEWDGTVREVGDYGTIRRAAHLHSKYPALNWSEATYTTHGVKHNLGEVLLCE